VAVALPIFGDPRADSFPLSTYPMFSGRKSAEATITHAIGFTPQGERVVLPPEAVANNEVVQAFETLRQAVRQGPEAIAALCETAAGWAADHEPDVAEVQVTSDTYDALRYFEGDEEPISSVVHAECAP
jgi:hypothetical protein